MSPLRPRPGHWLLRCPHCRCELTVAAGALVCRNRHGFDLAREGYVNLLDRRRHLPAAGGDSAMQLSHRAAFLDTGHFDAIATTIAAHVRNAGAPSAARWRVLDAGCGTGHHLARLTAALPAPAIGLGLDIAKDAARRAARRWPGLAFAVADIWSEWPVRDAAVDLIVSLFAPKNFNEMARVLRPRGWLALAYPGPAHLTELRDRFGLLQAREDRASRYAEMASRYIGPPTIVRLYRRAVLDSDAERDVILMGPNARHLAPARLDAVRKPGDVTFDIEILLARKSGTAT